VRNHQCRFLSHNAVQSILHQLLTLTVERRRCFVEKHDGGVPHEGSRNRNSLLLSPGQLSFALLTNIGIKLLRELVNEGSCVGGLQTRLNLAILLAAWCTKFDIAGRHTIGTLGPSCLRVFGLLIVLEEQITVDDLSAVQDVSLDGGAKEAGLLFNRTKNVAQSVDVVLLDRLSIDQNLSLPWLDVVKTLQQRKNCGFAAPATQEHW